MLNSIRRCIISLIGKDDGDTRIQQVSYNGKAQDAEIYAPYGMSYNLPPDSLCLYVQIGGDQGNLVVLPDRSKDRVKDLKEGEVAFFNPITKSRTVYRQNGDMEIVTEGDTGDLNITVKGDCNMNVGGDTNWAGDFNLDGNLNATGDVIADGDVQAGSVDLKTHTHIGSPTAATGPQTPTGVPN